MGAHGWRVEALAEILGPALGVTSTRYDAHLLWGRAFDLPQTPPGRAFALPETPPPADEGGPEPTPWGNLSPGLDASTLPRR
eukprot:5243964-Prymnesium_polylepis.1